MSASKLPTFHDINLLMERHLPQIGQIPGHVREKWFSRLCEAEAIDAKAHNIQPRPEWHVMRARGIGSSDVGGIVTDLRGGSTWFGGMRSVVMSKLLLDAPTPSTSDTRRGIFMEEMIRSMFFQKLRAQGADVKQRTDLAKAMCSPFPGGPEWLIGNPDDVVEINGTLFVVDYKAPRTSTLDKYQSAESVNFDYEAQLHHLGLRLSYEGHQAHYLLVSLDYNKFDLDIVDIDRDPGIVKDIREGCDMVWNDMVLKGHIPEVRKQETFDVKLVDADKMATLKEAAMRFTSLSGLQKTVKSELEHARDRIAVLSDDLSMGDSNFSLSGVTIKSERRPDIAECLKWLSRNDQTAIMEKIAGSPTEEDIKEMMEVFASASAEVPMTEDHHVGLSRARSGPHAEIISSFAQKWNSELPDLFNKIMEESSASKEESCRLTKLSV